MRLATARASRNGHAAPRVLTMPHRRLALAGPLGRSKERLHVLMAAPVPVGVTGNQ